MSVLSFYDFVFKLPLSTAFGSSQSLKNIVPILVGEKRERR